MARPPLPLADQVTAREILRRLDGLEKTAGEARDETLKLNARLTAENTQEQLAKIWTRMETADLQNRADLQNSYDRLNAAQSARSAQIEGNVAALTSDMDALKEWRNKIEGANGLVGWLAKHAPWLVTAAVAGLALIARAKG